ncbi:MAG: hypothetical protein IK080_01720 [Clostridia bacterium]|nr:hypothetical protein [Clostridia bacterium]
MKQGTLKLVSIILVLVLLGIPSAFALQQSQQDEHRAVLIQDASAEINVGTLSASVKATIKGESNVTSVKIQLELQKLSGGSYSTVKTWSETFSGRSGALEKSRVTSPFSTYRLKATVTAYASGTSESRTLYAY